MNVYIKILIVFSGFSLMQAQLNELGFFGGGNSFMGDIGEEKIYTPEGWYGSLYYKRNFNPWMSIRAEVLYTRTNIYDSKALNTGRKLRNWSVQMATTQLNLLLEYNFIPLNPYKRPKTILSTPYLASGISGFQHNAGVNLNPSGNVAYAGYGLALPMIFGIKFSLSRSVKAHWELAAYYYFNDNMDASREADVFPVALTNRYSNDWYIMSGIGFSIGFGKMPCYINVF